MSVDPALSIVAPFIIGGEIGMILLLLAGLRLARPAVEPARTRHGQTIWIVALVLASWFAVAMALAGAEVFVADTASGSGNAALVPPIVLAIALPLFIGITAVLAWRRLGEALAAVPASWLVGVQAYRVIGAVFLYLHARDGLPGIFALPAGIGDVLVGVAALPVAYALRRTFAGARAAAIVWNIAGIGDLVLAVTLGFLSSPSPYQVFALNTPNVLIGHYPLVMIPLFAVPLSIILHAASLRSLYDRPPAPGTVRR